MSNNNNNNFIIKLQKYQKENNMLDYSISILSDGSIVYKEKEKINSNNLPSKISEGSLGRLIDEFIDIYFFAMNDRYIQTNDKNTFRIELSVKWQTKHKKIVFDNNPLVPPELVEFQKLIEQTMGIKK